MRLEDNRMSLDGSVTETFDFLADCANEADWNPDLKSIRRIDSGPLRTGAEWEGDYRGMGRMSIRLDEYERPHRLTFTTTGPRMAMRFSFELQADGASTQVRADADIEPKGAMKLASPLLGAMMRSTMGRRPRQMNEGLRRQRAARTA